MLRIDDALDLGAEHAIGGIVGLFFNGLFADSSLIALDGVNTSVSGGWINHNWKQLYIQIAYICATVGYTFVVTATLAKLLDMIPFLQLRASSDDEALGMDDTQVRTVLWRYEGLLFTVSYATRLASSCPTTWKCAA